MTMYYCHNCGEDFCSFPAVILNVNSNLMAYPRHHDSLFEKQFDKIKKEWEERQLKNWKDSFEHYQWALDNDIAKECARAVLPLQAKTRLFMNGTLRSWVHYINLRSDPSTQKEHRDIAEAMKLEFIKKFPIISEAAGWS